MAWIVSLALLKICEGLAVKTERLGMTQMQTDLGTDTGALDWAKSCIISELLKTGQSDPPRRALADQQS